MLRKVRVCGKVRFRRRLINMCLRWLHNCLINLVVWGVFWLWRYSLGRMVRRWILMHVVYKWWFWYQIFLMYSS